MAAFDSEVLGSVTRLETSPHRARRAAPAWLIAAASVMVLAGVGIGIGFAGSGSDDTVTIADSAAVPSSAHADAAAGEAASEEVAAGGAADEAEAAPQSKSEPALGPADGLGVTDDPSSSIPDFGEFADDHLLRAAIDGSTTSPFAADAVVPSPTTYSSALTCLSAQPTWRPLGTATVGGDAVLIVIVHSTDGSSSWRLVVDQQTCATRPL